MPDDWKYDNFKVCVNRGGICVHNHLACFSVPGIVIEYKWVQEETNLFALIECLDERISHPGWTGNILQMEEDLENRIISTRINLRKTGTVPFTVGLKAVWEKPATGSFRITVHWDWYGIAITRYFSTNNQCIPGVYWPESVWYSCGTLNVDPVNHTVTWN